MDFTAALDIDPKYAKAYINRANVKASLGDYKGALIDYDSTIVYNPKFAFVYYSRGVAYERLGKMELALKDFNKAIELNPQDAASYFYRGIVKLSLDAKDAGACLDLNKAAKLGFKDAYDMINKYCK